MILIQRLFEYIELKLIQGGVVVNLVAVLLLWLFGLAVQNLSTFQNAEWTLYDRGVELIRAWDPQPVANEVVVIGIDEQTFQQFPEPFALWHVHFADLLGALAIAKPSVVGMDVVLPDRSYESVVSGIDRALMHGLIQIRSEVPVFYAQTLDDSNRPRSIFAGFRALIGEDHFASAILCLDDDSVLRRHLADGCQTTGQSSALASKMAKSMGVPDRGYGLIDYRVGDMIDPIPMHRIIDLFKRNDTEELRKLLGGKPVLVGLVLPLEDRLRVPVAIQAQEPDNRRVSGVVAHAQLLRALINHGLVNQVSFWVEGLLIALACLWWFVRHGFQKSAVYWSSFIVLPLLCFYLLWLGTLLMPAVIMLVAKTAFVTRRGVDWLRIDHQRKGLMKAFTGHLNKTVLKRLILEHPDRPEMGLMTTRSKVAVFASRLVDTESIHSQPEGVMARASEYYRVIKTAADQYGGVVDRMQDNEVLVWFGAPLCLADPERAALEAALFVRREWKRMKDRCSAQRIDQHIHIGIATGEAVVGRANLRGSSPFVVIGPVVEEARALTRHDAEVLDDTCIAVCLRTASAVNAHGFTMGSDGRHCYLKLS